MKITQLDTIRFRALIAQQLKLAPTQVTALILGEHGDSMVPIWSSATAAGLPLDKYAGWSTNLANELFTRTKGSGAEVIKKKGGAGFAVGVSIADVGHSIALDQRRILPVSSLQNGGSPGLVPNAGLIQLAGNPEDGWTLLSWAGQEVPENPGVLGDLFLIWRDLVLPPQVALDHVFDALISGDSAALAAAFSDGLTGISTALEAIPDTLNNLAGDLAASTW